ncbi:MAG: hypothetical protein ABI649_05640 [Gaiellaceae bacterium]
MRLLLGLAAFGILFVGVFWASSRVSAGESSPNPPSAAAPPVTTTPEESSKPAKRSKNPSSNKSHDYQEHHAASDMRLARKAVLHPDDVAAIWHPADLGADSGPGCPQNDPDLSRLTVTGRARSLYRTDNGASTESRVKLFANAGQAAAYFEATSNRTVLLCIRNGIKGWLKRKGLQPSVLYARLETEPAIGARTAIYLVSYAITISDGTRVEYPTEYLSFQVGRAVGGVSYTMVFSPDGSRPCECELDEARLMASRLYRT